MTEPTRAPKKIDAADLDPRVLALYNRGETRNGIARELGVSTRQVDYSAQRQGFTFDASRTRKAVEVHTASAGEAHRKLAGRFRDLADQALDRANENICAPDVMWQYVRAAATSVDKSIALADLDTRTTRDDSMATAGAQLDLFMSLVMDKASPRPAVDAGAPPIYQPEDDAPP